MFEDLGDDNLVIFVWFVMCGYHFNLQFEREARTIPNCACNCANLLKQFEMEVPHGDEIESHPTTG